MQKNPSSSANSFTIKKFLNFLEFLILSGVNLNRYF